MKLSHSVIQANRRGINESELIVTVDYDPATRTVEGVKSIVAYNSIKNVTTDLTSIFGEVYDEALNSIVEQINWDDVFLAHIDVDQEKEVA